MKMIRGPPCSACQTRLSQHREAGNTGKINRLGNARKHAQPTLPHCKVTRCGRAYGDMCATLFDMRPGWYGTSQ